MGTANAPARNFSTTAKATQSAETNPAVARCVKAWNATLQAATIDEQDEDEFQDPAGLAYCGVISGPL